jgi:hypothetical protein
MLPDDNIHGDAIDLPGIGESQLVVDVDRDGFKMLSDELGDFGISGDFLVEPSRGGGVGGEEVDEDRLTRLAASFERLLIL